MSKQKPQITTLTLPITGNELSTADNNLFKKYLYHWPLFILGAIVFIAFAFLYLQVAKPVYPIMATIEFKSPTASSASLTVNQTSTEQTLDPIDKPVIVENEIEVMQSKKIIFQVVNELQLWVTYTQKKGLKTKDLYGVSPVKFQLIKQNGNIGPAGEKLQIIINDQNSFFLKDTDGVNKNYTYNTPIKNSFGTWQLSTTANLENYSTGSVIKIAVQDPDLVSDACQKNIKVELQDKDAPFVNLSTSDKIPERGKDVLNALLALYLQFSLEDKNKLSQKTLKFINYRIDSLKNELNTVERQIEQFKTSHDISFSVDTEAENFQKIKQLNLTALDDVKIQLGILDVMEKYANSPENSEKLPAVSGNLTDQGLNSLYDKLSELQIKRQVLLSTAPETNPYFKSVNNQMRTLKNDFLEKIMSIKSTLLVQRKQLESIISGAQSSLKKVPGEDRELTVLKTIQESKASVYQFLLSKREQVGLRYASTVSDAEIIDDAHAGSIKWPNVPVVYGLALILGLAAAAGVLYARESLNDLIISRKQIEDETGVPILGELVYQQTDKQVVVSEGRSKFAIGEQFRVLRTNLYHLHGNNDSGRVTLFTSSVSSEGKSFVSSNLAVTLAYASRKTIILEMDLRKPKISVNFGLSAEHPGISNFLNGASTNLQELIQPSGIPYLDVLGCGPLIPNPSELLEKEKLDELIASLRKVYDDIIIDSPPIHLVTDALIMARVADVSLYVVRQGYTHKYELEFINEINEAKRFPKFTIVFNGVKRGASGHGYGYGYGYGGYGNSYNSYAGKDKDTLSTRIKGVLRRF